MTEYEADRLWASVVKETGIWMSPYAEQVADFGRRLIPQMRDALATTRDAALEEAALACERRRDETGPQEAYAVLDVQSYTSACSGCAYDIRALKGTAHD